MAHQAFPSPIARQRRREPGQTTADGYGWSHQRLRKKLEPEVKRGDYACWRCGRLIDPDGPWHLGHDDDDRSITRGPEHVECNLGRRPAPAAAPARWNSEAW